MERVRHITRQVGASITIPSLQSFYGPVSKVIQVVLAVRRGFHDQVSDKGTGTHLYQAQGALVSNPSGRLAWSSLPFSQVLHHEPHGILDAPKRSKDLRHEPTRTPII